MTAPGSRPTTAVDDWKVPHQDKVERVVDARTETFFAQRGTTVIADPVAPSATYTQSEAAATRDALVALLGVLRTQGVIAS